MFYQAVHPHHIQHPPVFLLKPSTKLSQKCIELKNEEQYKLPKSRPFQIQISSKILYHFDSSECFNIIIHKTQGFVHIGNLIITS